jgi:hypothetical protein
MSGAPKNFCSAVSSGGAPILLMYGGRVVLAVMSETTLLKTPGPPESASMPTVYGWHVVAPTELGCQNGALVGPGNGDALERTPGAGE